MNLTMTTGRRLGLFVRTMDSLLSNCLDLDLIDRWLVSDDGSSDDDLRTMKERYPFLEIERSPKPGQPASLNALFARAGGEWFLHWEDDWETVHSGHFIRNALRVAQADDRIREVVFRYWDGILIIDGDLSYRGHVFRSEGCRSGSDRYDWSWYGYSLNPSLQHLPTVREIGRYDETAGTRFFDRPPALRYRHLGYLRANLDCPIVQHIGEGCGAWELGRS